MIDWEQVRNVRFRKERPADWPKGVFAISMEGVTLLGVHEQSNKLYWDGNEIVTRHILALPPLGSFLAVISAIGIFGNFLINCGNTFHWW
jgi:hypothetical protein|nr:hypothetical protein Hi04_10k_c5342_00026 [uncultured bacterium]